MGLGEELELVAATAGRHAAPGEQLAAVIPAEPSAGERVYLCAFSDGREEGARSWIALDHRGAAVAERRVVRDAVAIAALCEVAEERGEGLAEAVRTSGLEAPDEAVAELERALRPAPRLATPSYLDEVGAATRALELALGAESVFAQAMRAASSTVEELELDVERGYKVPLR